VTVVRFFAAMTATTTTRMWTRALRRTHRAMTRASSCFPSFSSSSSTSPPPWRRYYPRTNKSAFSRHVQRFKLEKTTPPLLDDDDYDYDCDDNIARNRANRAETIVNYALESGKDIVVVDVGCGHGQMSLLLYSLGVKTVIGIDRSENEVKYAKDCLKIFLENAIEEGQRTKNRIEFRLGDGLDGVMEENLDVVILAGMGTKLIRKIISGGERKSSIHTLVLNPPAGELVEFREWLWRNEWCIEKESLVVENANAHVILKCTKKKKTTSEEEKLSVLDLWLGKLQEERKSSNVKAYAINRRDYAKERIDVLERLKGEGRLRDDRELEHYRKAHIALASWLEEKI
jgi:tRNA A22 N-methylase